MSESRSEFEAWYVETYPNGWGVARFNGSGRYCHDHPSNQWICWQASRRAALEEAAKVCETAPDCLQDSTFDGAARAIRELAGKTKEGQEP